jgi:stalled ribosome rescue protein Dom34
MNTTAGLWIDEREAVIAFVSKQGVRTKTINSHGDQPPGESVSSTPEPQAPPALDADAREREKKKTLSRFLDRIIWCMNDAESVLILGPDETKDELKKRFEKYLPRVCLLAVETADKVNGHQIAARLREYVERQSSGPRAYHGLYTAHS